MKLGRTTARRAVRRIAELAGWQVVAKTYQSPIPDLATLPDEVFERESRLPGLELDSAAHAAFAERELAPYLAEFGTGPPGYQRRNPYYELGDAEIAYAMVRRLRPRRIVELGSGFSTLVLGHAVERNRSEGAQASLVSFDPEPRETVAAHRPLTVQDIPQEEFETLAAGDLLFVDTSHTVKVGGDVNRIVLEILPGLAAGVVVHFHDIWLPFEYHRAIVREMELFWNEQYLLQAFLAMNSGYEVLFATRALHARRPELFERLIPGFDGQPYPTSFWIRRLG